MAATLRSRNYTTTTSFASVYVGPSFNVQAGDLIVIIAAIGLGNSTSPDFTEVTNVGSLSLIQRANTVSAVSGGVSNRLGVWWARALVSETITPRVNLTSDVGVRGAGVVVCAFSGVLDWDKPFTNASPVTNNQASGTGINSIAVAATAASADDLEFFYCFSSNNSGGTINSTVTPDFNVSSGFFKQALTQANGSVSPRTNTFGINPTPFYSVLAYADTINGAPKAVTLVGAYSNIKGDGTAPSLNCGPVKAGDMILVSPCIDNNSSAFSSIDAVTGSDGLNFTRITERLDGANTKRVTFDLWYAFATVDNANMIVDVSASGATPWVVSAMSSMVFRNVNPADPFGGGTTSTSIFSYTGFPATLNATLTASNNSHVDVAFYYVVDEESAAAPGFGTVGVNQRDATKLVRIANAYLVETVANTTNIKLNVALRRQMILGVVLNGDTNWTPLPPEAPQIRPLIFLTG